MKRATQQLQETHHITEQEVANLKRNAAELFNGETDAAFRWLDRAYRQRDPGMEMLKIDPLLRNLHSDPRFQAMLVRMSLAD